MFTIEESQRVDASVEEVWRVLADVAGWPRWNPYVPASSGELRPGAVLDFVALPGGAPRRFTPEVLEVEAARRVRYRHRVLGGAILDADHTIELRAEGDHTIVVQREHFRGLVPALFGATIQRDAKAGFAAMNHGLASHFLARARRPIHTMRAIVLDRYGGPEVLKVAELKTPAPKADEILVRTIAVGLNQGDAKRRGGELGFLFSARAPNVLGYDVCGDVVAVGGAVSGIEIGDRVFGMQPVPRGGTYAEYTVLPASGVAKVERTVDPIAAAVTPLAGMTALQALRDHARVGPSSRVYVNGAAGGVGTFAVQIARILGAEVTAASSPDAHELLRSLGAAQVVDRHQGHGLAAHAWDAIFDPAGSLSFPDVKRFLKPNGRLVTIVPSPAVFAQSVTSRLGGPRSVTFLVKAKTGDLRWLADRLASGEIRPVVERTYRFDEAVAAHARLSSGRVRGKLAFTVSID